jgi:3-hydroxybutyryl-CoA dehydrogenase
MNIKHILVIGAGTMGHGISLVAAQSGFDVSLVDLNDQILEKAIAQVKRFLDGSVKRAKITQEEYDSTLSRIHISTNLAEEAKKADFLIETIVEDQEIKSNMFSELDEICSNEIIFATNTSQLSITSLGEASKRPGRFIGMHWFNPPPIMRLIEIPMGLKTSSETLDTVIQLSKKMGKHPFPCKDSPGFIVNRILNPWYNEGMNILDEGVASAEDIDTAVKAGGGFRMGPLELRDMVGLDTALHIHEYLYQRLGNDKFKPPFCLKQLVAAGNLGRKTGKGFFDYTETKKE